MKDKDYSVLQDKHTQELRRGVLVLATLSQLEQAKYGYALIEEFSKKGLDIDQGTLYPLLRRLEEQGLLDSEWNVEGSRPRRYYKISSKGKEMLMAMTSDFYKLFRVMEELLDGGMK